MEEGGVWFIKLSGIVLAAASFLVALLLGFISDSEDSVKSSLGWSDLFIGVTVIALIDNMAALFSAVKMAFVACSSQENPFCVF